jgi:hypothetical protein
MPVRAKKKAFAFDKKKWSIVTNDRRHCFEFSLEIPQGNPPVATPATDPGGGGLTATIGNALLTYKGFQAI